jgi:PAS domain S-box-containing protein
MRRRFVDYALRAPHIVGPAAAIVIVMAIAAYSYTDGQAYKEAARGAEATRAAVNWIERLVSLLREAESGQRGYLLTGEQRFLDPYTAALPEIAAERAKVNALHFADPDGARLLSTLTAERLEQMATTIRVHRTAGSEAVADRLRTDQGKPTSDELRALATRLLDEENEQLAHREARVARHGYQTRIVVIAGALLLALLLWLTSVRVNHLVSSKEVLISELASSREQEQRGRAALATTLRSIGDAVITTDAFGRVQFLNAMAESLTGWSSTAAQGRPLTEVFRIVNEATRQPVEDPSARVLRAGTVVGLANHTILLTRDGRQVPIDDSGAPVPDEHGKIAGVVLVFRDVTQRRQTQRNLEESERRYRLLFEANPSPMWVYDRADLSFLAVNEAAIKHYGYSREEFLSMTLRDIRPAEDVRLMVANASAPRRALHTDGPWRHRRKDGSIIFVEITSHPIQFGNTPACLILSYDVTDRLRLEEQLRQAQKLEAVGQLAGGIAHDFNNLLTVVEGYAELVHGDLLASDPNRQPVEEILVAAQRAAALTRQLLAFSRRQMLQPIRVSLNANVSSTQRMLSRLLGENIEIATKLEPDLWDVFADPGQIDQILLNLSVNARDAMEHGGRLTVSTANVELDAASAAAEGAAAGRYASLSVADTGHGMDAETQQHIFEPFFTTKEIGRGTGLGLSTVYGIVKQSGGYILVESAPGKGSKFTILLPAIPDQSATGAASTQMPAAPIRHEETILVVEDDASVRQLVGAMLRSSGYAVVAPSAPQEALALCADPGTRIDLLLTDMVLPETDGAAIADAARRARPGLKVLYMSGYTEHAVLRRNPVDGDALFLPKPFTKAALLDKVREALE